MKCLSSHAAFFIQQLNSKINNQKSTIKNPLPKFWARKIALLGRTYGQGYCTYTVVVITDKCTMEYIYLRTLVPQIPILGQKIYPLAPGEAQKPVRSIRGMPIAGPTTARRATRTTRLAPTTLEPVKVRQKAFKRVLRRINNFHQLSTTYTNFQRLSEKARFQGFKVSRNGFQAFGVSRVRTREN